MYTININIKSNSCNGLDMKWWVLIIGVFAPPSKWYIINNLGVPIHCVHVVLVTSPLKFLSQDKGSYLSRVKEWVGGCGALNLGSMFIVYCTPKKGTLTCGMTCC